MSNKETQYGVLPRTRPRDYRAVYLIAVLLLKSDPENNAGHICDIIVSPYWYLYDVLFNYSLSCVVTND